MTTKTESNGFDWIHYTRLVLVASEKVIREILSYYQSNNHNRKKERKEIE